ncbi:DNA primase [Ignavibacterium album]|uniref:DNA primase n=1 Tax=Ignavibacterium album TaxID=591197 RepID=UPI0035B9D63D
MRISESKIEEIRNAANIVDVVSEYVQLRKRGRNYIGLCPFHSEKTPSFTVSDEKQIYHCFGCHNGGNVFKFLMEYKKISFIEAVQELAEQFGIELNYDDSVPEGQSEQEILFDINTEVARYFSNNLLNDGEGQIARDYFQKRNIKVQTMRAFGLGYALNGWENLVSFLKQKNIDLEKALQLGLIGRNKDGRVYDKLAGRIIFPIFSPNGRVVAFAGRKLREDDTGGKYINSPESIIYVKGRILYGLSFAKDEIRKLDKAIIVEGYMDLISLYQAGIKNVVAVSGTALTDDQAQLLSRYTKNVVLLFDADTAGISASMRSIEILLRKDFDVKIATLPSGEDPDSFVNKYGKDEFEEVIKRSENFLEYQTAYYEKQGMFNDPTKAAEAIRELVRVISLVQDDLKRAFLVKISRKFNIRENLLERELDQVLSKNKVVPKFQENLIDTKHNISTKLFDEKIRKFSTPQNFNFEIEIIRFLFGNDEGTSKYILENVDEEDLEYEIHSYIIKKAKETYNTNLSFAPGELLLEFDDEVRNYILSWEKKFITEKNYDTDDNIQRYVQESIRRLRERNLELKIKLLTEAIQNTTDEEYKKKLLIENKDLINKKKELLKFSGIS